MTPSSSISSSTPTSMSPSMPPSMSMYPRTSPRWNEAAAAAADQRNGAMQRGRSRERKMHAGVASISSSPAPGQSRQGSYRHIGMDGSISGSGSLRHPRVHSADARPQYRNRSSTSSFGMHSEARAVINPSPNRITSTEGRRYVSSGASAFSAQPRYQQQQQQQQQQQYQQYQRRHTSSQMQMLVKTQTPDRLHSQTRSQAYLNSVQSQDVGSPSSTTLRQTKSTDSTGYQRRRLRYLETQRAKQQTYHANDGPTTPRRPLHSMQPQPHASSSADVGSSHHNEMSTMPTSASASADEGVRNNLIMYGNGRANNDQGSIHTGMSQQELLRKQQTDQDVRQRKDKKYTYGKKKRKDRILNISILRTKGSGSFGSAENQAQHNYQNQHDAPSYNDAAANMNAYQVEQNPATPNDRVTTAPQRSSRSSSRSKSPGKSERGRTGRGKSPRRFWNMISSFSRSKSPSNRLVPNRLACGPHLDDKNTTQTSVSTADIAVSSYSYNAPSPASRQLPSTPASGPAPTPTHKIESIPVAVDEFIETPVPSQSPPDTMETSPQPSSTTPTSPHQSMAQAAIHVSQRENTYDDRSEFVRAQTKKARVARQLDTKYPNRSTSAFTETDDSFPILSTTASEVFAPATPKANHLSPTRLRYSSSEVGTSSTRHTTSQNTHSAMETPQRSVRVRFAPSVKQPQNRTDEVTTPSGSFKEAISGPVVRVNGSPTSVAANLYADDWKKQVSNANVQSLPKTTSPASANSADIALKDPGRQNPRSEETAQQTQNELCSTKPKSILRKGRMISDSSGSDVQSRANTDFRSPSKTVRISSNIQEEARFSSELPPTLSFKDNFGKELSPIRQSQSNTSESMETDLTSVTDSETIDSPERHNSSMRGGDPNVFMQQQHQPQDYFHVASTPASDRNAAMLNMNSNANQAAYVPASDAEREFIESVASVVLQTTARQYLAKKELELRKEIAHMQHLQEQQAAEQARKLKEEEELVRRLEEEQDRLLKEEEQKRVLREENERRMAEEERNRVFEKQRQEKFEKEQAQKLKRAAEAQEQRARQVRQEKEAKAQLSLAQEVDTLSVQLFDVAAIQIQAAFRGWWVRDSLVVDHYCATKIQSLWRMHRSRRMPTAQQGQRQLQDDAVVQMAALQGVDDDGIACMMAAVVAIQTYYRGYNVRRHLSFGAKAEQTTKSTAATNSKSAKPKGTSATVQSDESKLNHAVALLQSYVRGWVTRHIFDTWITQSGTDLMVTKRRQQMHALPRKVNVADVNSSIMSNEKNRRASSTVETPTPSRPTSLNHPVSPQNLGAYAASSAVLRNSYDDDDVLEQYAERPISTKQQSVASSDPVPTVQATKQAKQPATQDAPKKHRSFKMRPGVVKRPGNYGDDEARLEAMHNKFRSVGLMEHSFRHHEQVLATWRSTMKRKDGQNEDGHDAAAETTTTATSTSTTKAAPVVAQPPPPSTLDAKLARKPSYEHRANSSSSRSHEGAVFNSSTTLTNGQGSIRRSLAASSRSSPRVVGSWSKRTGSQRQLDA